MIKEYENKAVKPGNVKRPGIKSHVVKPHVPKDAKKVSK